MWCVLCELTMAHTKFGVNMPKHFRDTDTVSFWHHASNFCQHGLKMIWFDFGLNRTNGLGGVQKSRFLKKIKMADRKFGWLWQLGITVLSMNQGIFRSHYNGQNSQKAISIYLTFYYNFWPQGGTVSKRLEYIQVMVSMVHTKIRNGTPMHLSNIAFYIIILYCSQWQFHVLFKYSAT